VDRARTFAATIPSLFGSESGKIASCQALICIDERLDDLGVDLVPMSLSFFRRFMSLKLRPGNRHRRREVICVPIFVEMYLMNA